MQSCSSWCGKHCQRIQVPQLWCSQQFLPSCLPYCCCCHWHDKNWCGHIYQQVEKSDEKSEDKENIQWGEWDGSYIHDMQWSRCCFRPSVEQSSVRERWTWVTNSMCADSVLVLEGVLMTKSNIPILSLSEFPVTDELWTHNEDLKFWRGVPSALFC